jgi:hypothetical protein
MCLSGSSVGRIGGRLFATFADSFPMLFLYAHNLKGR